MGGGVGGFYHNTNAASFTPTLSLRLGVGKVVSPMVSFRLGFEKAWSLLMLPRPGLQHKPMQFIRRLR